jgi:hypothetical protein
MGYLLFCGCLMLVISLVFAAPAEVRSRGGGNRGGGLGRASA